MKPGDLVICEMQKRSEPMGTVEKVIGVVLSKPSPQYPSEAVMWHGWNVLVRGKVQPFPERLLSGYYESR